MLRSLAYGLRSQIQSSLKHKVFVFKRFETLNNNLLPVVLCRRGYACVFINSVNDATSSPLLSVTCPVFNALRTTYILKRRYPEELSRVGHKLKRLRPRHFVYDLVEDTDARKIEPLKVLLTSFVSGVGKKGQIIEVNRRFGRTKLLLPGLAVYPTPRNIELYGRKALDDDEDEFSTHTAAKTIQTLSAKVVSVVMNLHEPWVLQPWHVRASLRKAGFTVPEDAITLPEKEICGPDLNLEMKEFYVIITVNRRDKVKVRCRIHHWATNEKDRLPYKTEFWHEEVEPIFPEDKEVLDSLPRPRRKQKQEQMV